MLHEPSIERIKAFTPDADEIRQTFQQLISQALEEGADGMGMLVCFIDEEDEFVEGTFVPEIHLVVRKVTDGAN